MDGVCGAPGVQMVSRRCGWGLFKHRSTLQVITELQDWLFTSLIVDIPAEGVGFEPTRPVAGPTGFQDRRLRPLGHPSVPYRRFVGPPSDAWLVLHVDIQAANTTHDRR